MLQTLVTPIELGLRRMPTLTVGIQAFIVRTLQRQDLYFIFFAAKTQSHKVSRSFMSLGVFAPSCY
jgi:hypothetical protein